MLLAAALLIFLTGCAHSYLGERYILIRLFKRDNLPKLLGGTELTAGTLRCAWHVTTVAWWTIALPLVLASLDPLSHRWFSESSQALLWFPLRRPWSSRAAGTCLGLCSYLSRCSCYSRHEARHR